MAKAPGTWLAPVKIAPNARLRGSDDRKPEDPPRASHRSPRGAADDRRPALAQHQTLGRTAQGRGGGRGQRWLADDRRGARALQPDARGIRLVAARGRPFGHAGPARYAHPALPRLVRTPAHVLSRRGPPPAARSPDGYPPSLRQAAGNALRRLRFIPSRAPRNARITGGFGVWAG